MKLVVFNRVQTLGRFNESLDDSWYDAIFILDLRLRTVNTKMWGNPTAEFVTGSGSKEIKFMFKKTGYLSWENIHNDVFCDYLDF
jgi:hypothetical protein